MSNHLNQAQVEQAVLSLGSFNAVKTARLADEVARQLGEDSAEAFGVYASGKPILAAILGQALKKLEAQGAISKQGRGVWSMMTGVTPAPAPAPAPVVLAPVEVEEVEVEEVEEEEVEEEEVAEVEVLDMSNTLYDLNDPYTRDWLISLQGCYGTYQRGDKECAKCVLSAFCAGAKKARSAERKAQRSAKAEVKAQAEALKALAPKGAEVKVPEGVDLSTARVRFLEVQAPCTCKATGVDLQVGDHAFFVPKWGVLSRSAGEAVGLTAP